MTRPKADSDPWLTDPVSRDREVSKAVVYGLRTIISLLRAIRDEQADESRVLRAELRNTQADIRDIWEYVATGGPTPPALATRPPYPRCGVEGCSLPDGHFGNHRGSVRGIHD